MESTSTTNLFVLCLVGLFVWDKYNKGSEKAILDNKDIQELAKDWGLWKTKGNDSLKSLWEGDLCKQTDASLLGSKWLVCKFQTGGSHYNYISPFKVEEVSLFPHIVIFHDFLSVDEVRRIQELSIPHLRPAGVGSGEDSKLDKGIRDAKHAWLSPNIDPVIKKLELRTKDATGLSMMASEQLQVGRYGIGGHYKPHFDHDTSGKEVHEHGNRAATILMYMEPVKEGGATVFTKLRKAIQPTARSAVFWYNLLPNGRSNYLTEHAACPVGWGDKWVINYWVREKANDPVKKMTFHNKAPRLVIDKQRSTLPRRKKVERR